MQADYDAVGKGGDSPCRPEGVEDFGAEMEASGLFRVVAERRYQWEMEYTADAYVDVLGTYSDHLMQEKETRERLFDLIRARIGDRTVRKSYLATLDVAVRT